MAEENKHNCDKTKCPNEKCNCAPLTRKQIITKFLDNGITKIQICKMMRTNLIELDKILGEN
jgi:hypothetical protein